MNLLLFLIYFHSSKKVKHMKRILTVFILLFSIGCVFSMDWNTCPRNVEEQVERRMAELIDKAIDEHVIPEQTEINTAAVECFNTFGRDFHAAFQAFTYQIPDTVPEISKSYISALSEQFHEALRLLSESQ